MTGDFITIRIICYNRKCMHNSDHDKPDDNLDACLCLKAVAWKEPPVITKEGKCRWYEIELERNRKR